MNRLFDTSVNVGLRQFYVLGAAGSIGNLFGFVGNVYIYGLSAPTICTFNMIVIVNTLKSTIINEQTVEFNSLSAVTNSTNRRYLNRYLERLAQKGKKDVYAALIDLDFFKKVNDEYGHAFGDEVLIEFARILERNLIADGIAVRFGGEEFMLILPDVTEEEIRHMLAKMSADYTCEFFRLLFLLHI